ncbi:MAG: alginate export family protein [Bacteroidales bacterium]
MKVIFLVFSILLSLEVYSQFVVDAVIRPRAEFRNGYKVLRDSVTRPAAFVSQRSRLGFEYKNKNLSTRITLYDACIWDEQELKKDITTIGIAEGWAELSIQSNWTIRFGRQFLKYDNSWLISPVNWNQIGAAHDAIKITFRKNHFQGDFVSAFNQTGEHLYGTELEGLVNSYKTLNIFWLSKSFGAFRFSTLNILEGLQGSEYKTATYVRFTPGLIGEYKSDGIRTAFRAFWQTGHLKDGREVDAWFLHIEGMMIPGPKTRLTAGIEIKSGNPSNADSGRISRAFDILYGARHRFNGDMDYFSTPATTLEAGLVNPYLRCNHYLSDRLDMTVTLHSFSLQGHYYTEGRAVDRFLGFETDLKARYRLNDFVIFEGGWAWMNTTDTMGVIKGGDPEKFNQWAWLMVTVSQELFRSGEN